MEEMHRVLRENLSRGVRDQAPGDREIGLEEAGALSNPVGKTCSVSNSYALSTRIFLGVAAPESGLPLPIRIDHLHAGSANQATISAGAGGYKNEPVSHWEACAACAREGEGDGVGSSRTSPPPGAARKAFPPSSKSLALRTRSACVIRAPRYNHPASGRHPVPLSPVTYPDYPRLNQASPRACARHKTSNKGRGFLKRCRDHATRELVPCCVASLSPRAFELS